MTFDCENCGWSEITGAPIICNYSGRRTWRDEYCEAWKPKEKETNMVEVVRCKDCKHHQEDICEVRIGVYEPDWYCADGERRTDDA